jgi:cobalamin biosynthesis Mg chelatase CobN
MCDPVTFALAAASTGLGIYSQNKAAKAQVSAINQQNQIQADEISKQAGQQLTERAKAAYRERASMRAAAAESGINLGSGSFLAGLQTSAMNQDVDSGLVIYNERAKQRARSAQATSAMSQIQMDSGLSAALKIGLSGASAAYQQNPRPPKAPKPK